MENSNFPFPLPSHLFFGPGLLFFQEDDKRKITARILRNGVFIWRLGICLRWTALFRALYPARAKREHLALSLLAC